MEINAILISHPVLLGIFSFMIGICTMPFVLKMAKEKKLLVKPNKRTSHSGSIPNIGGINIFVSFSLTYLLFVSSEQFDFQQKMIFAGMLLLLLVGFYDDIMDIKHYKKLIGEIIAGVLLIVVADIRITHLHGFLGIEAIPDIMSYLLSFFVYLLIVNALNFIDGVDGLASGIGILICAFFGVYFQLIGEISLSMMSYILIGALLIFFIYNVFGSKSKIFMGDSGSLVLGYIIFVLVANFSTINAYYASELNPNFVMKSAPVVAICVLAIPLIDMVRVMITRLKKGESLFVADRNHVHHLLLSVGLKHREVTFILLMTNSVFIALGLLIRNLKIEIAALIVVTFATILILILWKIVDFYHKDKGLKTNDLNSSGENRELN